MMVFTNCTDAFELTFEPNCLNDFFGSPKEYQFPFICIDNPFVYAQKSKQLIKDGRANEKSVL